MSAATEACAHDWRPIDGWYARYRCALCRVIGYKPAAVHPEHCHRTTIVPYRCESKCRGQRCPEPAVYHWRGKKCRCAAHGGPRRTGEARRAMAGEPRAPDGTGDGANATGASPAATAESPTATGASPTATGESPNPTGELLNATGAAPNATGESPTATGPAPNAFADAPNATDPGSA